MADLKVSQLPVATTAASTDKIIINTGSPQETKTITVSNLLSGGGGFDPLIADFDIDASAGDQTLSVAGSYQVSSDKKSLSVRYQKTWGDASLPNVMVSEPKTVTMPAGANAAIVIYQSNVEHRASGLPDLGTTSNRSVHTAHRLVVSGATYSDFAGGSASNDYSSARVQSVVILNGNSADIVESRVNTVPIQKFDLIQFTEGAQVTFTSKMAVQKGGRAAVTVRSGRVVVFPFNNDGNNIFALPFAVSSDPDRGLEANIQQDLDASSPPESDATQAQYLGRDIRDYIRRVISALDSRKNNIPTGSTKTISDYEAQITALWNLLDDQSLFTYELLQDALGPIIQEVSDPGYGVATIFKFESELGVTTRQLL